MTINARNDFFKNLITETQEKSEIRVYHKFIAILTDLENKALTDEQLLSIEKELDTLNVNTENRKKNFKHKLTLFVKFLKKLTGLTELDSVYAAAETTAATDNRTAFETVTEGLGLRIEVSEEDRRCIQASAEMTGL